MRPVLREPPRTVSLFTVLVDLFPAALLCALFVTVGVVHVTSRIWVVRIGYELSKEEQKNREMRRENDRLKLEISTLKSPSRLEQIARDELQMVPPPPGSVLTAAPAEKPLQRATSRASRQTKTTLAAREERP